MHVASVGSLAEHHAYNQLRVGCAQTVHSTQAGIGMLFAGGFAKVRVPYTRKGSPSGQSVHTGRITLRLPPALNRPCGHGKHDVPPIPGGQTASARKVYVGSAKQVSLE